MSEWKKVKLDDCLELITYGFTNPMPDTLSGPWKVTAKDINNGRIVFETARHTSQEAFDNDLTDKSRPKKGDILLTKDGTLGRLAIVGDERVCINQSVALLRVNKDILSVPYLYYLLSTPLYQAKMIADAGGAAIKHIYITRVNQLLIPCPSYDEQCRIANILSRYDSLIENYQKQIKLLEEAAQRLYKEWFVDLHFPGHENTKIVDGVPEGWEKKMMGEIVEINKRNIPKNYEYSFVNYTDLGNVRLGKMDTPIRYNYGEEPGRAKRVAIDGDIIWGMVRPNLKSYALVQYPKAQDVFSTGFAVLTAKRVPFSYLYCYVTTEAFVGYLINCTNGAAYPAVKPEHFSKADMVIPSKYILGVFNRLVEPMFRRVGKLQSQIRLLTEARDRLLPKLMSGEIAV
jgi:type I restriction enzyme S subunit